MKKLLLTMGILLIPAGASAQTISPWVTAVIERADLGKEMAETLTETNCEPESLLAAQKQNQDAFTKATDVGIDLAMESQFLHERTVCFDYDRTQLKNKIADIADTLVHTTNACRLEAAGALRLNYEFLVQAYRDFLKGAVDPSETSDQLMYDWSFHNPDLWSSSTRKRSREEGSVPSTEMCPFTSDYGSHTYVDIAPVGAGTPEIRSAGCDRFVLNGMPEPYQREAFVLREYIAYVSGMSRSLIQIVREALHTIEEIKALRSGGTPPPPSDPPPDEPEHVSIAGCVRPMEPHAGEPEEIEAILLAYPDFFEERHFNGFTFDPAPDQRMPSGLLFRPVHDYFSVFANNTATLRAFGQMRASADLRRPLPPKFQPSPNEGMFAYFWRVFVSSDDLKLISTNIDRETAYIDAADRDTAERMADATSVLRDAVQELSDTTSEVLMEGYIPDLSYFLARSCVDGHCQETLKTVAKRAFNPYCLPYVSDLYVEEDAYKKCYCDPSVQGSWSEWEQYCGDSVLDGEYASRQDPIAPMCAE